MKKNTNPRLNPPSRINMKKACFLFTIVGLGTLTLGLSYADEPPKLPTEQVLSENPSTDDRSADPAHSTQARGKTEQKEGKPSTPKVDSHESKPKEHSHASEKGKQAGPVRAQVKRPAEKESHQPELKRPAAKDKILMGKTGEPPGPRPKLPPGNEAVGPRPGVIRSRGATAALVSRVLITSNTKYSAGPLAGTTIKRRP
jgi:hypothetical protein